MTASPASGGPRRLVSLGVAVVTALAVGCAAQIPPKAPAGTSSATDPPQGVATATPAKESGPEFTATVKPLSNAERSAMTPAVWRPGCPVSLDDLRLVTVRHWSADGKVRTGRLVVHWKGAAATVRIMRALFDLRFPITRMEPIERYVGDDFQSIEADNTSAFNCRRRVGTGGWSQHAYGRAIDINPLLNPYVRGRHTAHVASRPYLNRNRVRPGMLVAGSEEVAVIEAEGWGWAGAWPGKIQDYQHISATGR